MMSEIRKLCSNMTSMEEARMDAHPEIAYGVKIFIQVIVSMQRMEKMMMTKERIRILTEIVSINTDIVLRP